MGDGRKVLPFCVYKRYVMNIRIGNDIKVKFTIRGPQGFDKVNVKQMQVYFINTTFENDERECIVKRRFPKEPFPQFYTPSKYSIHGCGPWSYHTNPRKCDYATCLPGIIDPHIWPYYNGFGLTPDKFVDCPNGIISYKPKHLVNEPIYLAPSLLTEETSSAEAYFPAHEQIMCGPYKMVVVLVMYENGWGKNNLHTYTIDYGVLFNIVDDSTGITGNIIIDGDTGELVGSKIIRMYFAQDDYYVGANTQLTLGVDLDQLQKYYKLYIVLDNGSVAEYRKTMFTDDDIQFESSDTDTVIVTTDGKLFIGNVTGSKVVTITAKDSNTEIETSCNIHIDSSAFMEFIGFAPTKDVSEIDLDAKDDSGHPLFTSYNYLSGNYHVENYNTGYYLWILAKSPIKDIQSKTFDVPLSDVVEDGQGHYCYYCPNALIATDFDFTIER